MFLVLKGRIKMLFLKGMQIVLVLIFSFGFLFQAAISQEKKEAPKQEATTTPPSQAKPSETPQANTDKARVVVNKACECLAPATKALNEAFAAVEEDEWQAAIKKCTDTVSKSDTVAKTCKCPEVSAYQNIAKAYLNYAKGGSILDSEDTPNCMAASKAYNDAIKWLKESQDKIADKDTKANARIIEEYAAEELDFLKDECEEETTPAQKSGGKNKT